MKVRAAHARAPQSMSAISFYPLFSYPRYGLDVIVDADLQPHILEATLSPDTARANKYTPTYTNDVFGTLFFGETHNFTRL